MKAVVIRKMLLASFMLAPTMVFAATYNANQVADAKILVTSKFIFQTSAPTIPQATRDRLLAGNTLPAAYGSGSSANAIFHLPLTVSAQAGAKQESVITYDTTGTPGILKLVNEHGDTIPFLIGGVKCETVTFLGANQPAQKPIDFADSASVKLGTYACPTQSTVIHAGTYSTTLVHNYIAN